MTMTNRWRAWRLVAAGVACAAAVVACAAAGCRSGGPDHLPTERERVDMLSLMLPHEIRIQPFTQIKSFNEDEIPDGINLVLRPLDRFGDPIKAVGGFQFELWTYQNASGERKGERLAFWERTIANAEEVRLYWRRGARMYDFQLAWTRGAEAIQPGRKFVLTATYRTPWDEAITDEYVIDFHLPADVLGTAAAGTGSE